jgi:hypothetical protein
LDIVPELTDAEAKRSYAGKQSGKKPISEWAFIQLFKIKPSPIYSQNLLAELLLETLRMIWLRLPM